MEYICQCCGMPLDETLFSTEPDGTVNRDYCKWCYADGKFTYDKLETLIDFCVEHFASEQMPAAKMRAYMEQTLPKLKYWQTKTAE